MKFALISDFEITENQRQIAAKYDIELEAIGNYDSFKLTRDFVESHGNFSGVIILHPAAALRLCKYYLIGIFEKHLQFQGNQPTIFLETDLHIYDLRN